MKYKIGDKVKVISPAFAKTWENMGRKNEWVIDFIQTQSEGYPSLYICYSLYEMFILHEKQGSKLTLSKEKFHSDWR